MKIIKNTILVLSLFAVLAHAQDTKYGGAFLELGVGARNLGMGSTGLCNTEDGSAFYYNPGGVAFLGNIQLTAMYASLFNSLENHSFANATFPILGGAMISASWIRLAVEDIPRYNDADLAKEQSQRENDPAGSGLTDPAQGYFSNSNNAYVVTFAKLQRWNADLGWQYFEVPIDIGYGVSFKLIDIGLDDKSASGMGFDAGIKVQMGLDDIFSEEIDGNLIMGLSSQDLFNTTVTWDTDSKQQDLIERSWNLGIAYVQAVEFLNSRIALAYDYKTKYDGSAHVGFEVDYKSTFALRIGSNDGNFTAGAGIKYWRLQLDYAYQNHDLGNSHRIGTIFYFQ